MKEEIAARQAVKELTGRAEKGAAELSFQQDPPAGLLTSPNCQSLLRRSLKLTLFKLLLMYRRTR